MEKPAEAGSQIDGLCFDVHRLKPVAIFLTRANKVECGRFVTIGPRISLTSKDCQMHTHVQALEAQVARLEQQLATVQHSSRRGLWAVAVIVSVLAVGA